MLRTTVALLVLLAVCVPSFAITSKSTDAPDVNDIDKSSNGLVDYPKLGDFNGKENDLGTEVNEVDARMDENPAPSEPLGAAPILEALKERYPQFASFASYGFNPLGLSPLGDLSQAGKAGGVEAELAALLRSLVEPQQNQVQDLESCNEDMDLGIKYYCLKLEDGQYYDPWNSYCGFIECSSGVARRMCCEDGTYMGSSMMTMAEMCRRPLDRRITDLACTRKTSQYTCTGTKTVMDNNPPVRKV